MSDTKPTVVRLSLRWVVAAMIAVLALGVIGGMIGVSLYTPQAPLSAPGNGHDQLVTTVQQVTVSPSKAAAEIVQNSDRSILTLAHGSRKKPVLLSTATVVTNDGILITRHDPVSDEVFAIDSTGTYLALDAVGRDSINDIVFYRVRDGVLAPIELAEADPDVGALLLTLTRSNETNAPVVANETLTQYAVSSESDPVGWQRVGSLTAVAPMHIGSPLLTDSGKVAGLITDDTTARMIPVSYLRHSLDRLASGKREFNPFDLYGFTVHINLEVATDESGLVPVFSVATVSGETKNHLRVGDIISVINDQSLATDSDIAELLSQPAPLTLTVQRAGQQQTVTIPFTTPAS